VLVHLVDAVDRAIALILLDHFAHHFIVLADVLLNEAPRFAAFPAAVVFVAVVALLCKHLLHDGSQVRLKF